MIYEKVLIERLEKKRNASDTLFDNVVEMNAYDDGIDDVIKIVNQLAEEHKGKDTNVPSNDGWIACSERLPEENANVLIQINFRDDVKMSVASRMDFNYWTGFGRDVNVIAWQPLPAPYMPKGE